MPYGTRAPKEIQHHPSACYRADLLFPLPRPEGRGCGDRECVTGDHLPFRGLAVPEPNLPRPGDPDGVCFLRSPSESATCVTSAHRSRELPGLLAAAPETTGRLARQTARRPTALALGGGPDCRTPQHARLQSDAFAELPHINRLLVLPVAAPETCGPPRAAARPVAILQETRLRDSAATLNCELTYYYPPVHLCRVSLDLVYGRNVSRATPRCLLPRAQILECPRWRKSAARDEMGVSPTGRPNAHPSRPGPADRISSHVDP
ncbi:hypothetical protein SNS2_4463 [Streptomyces netropsis]|nr:hypothetical protein SNS2_4463 [Streptomyces netropsis]